MIIWRCGSFGESCLDSGDFHEHYDDETMRFLEAFTRDPATGNFGLLVSFDGASRGNPGAAAIGVSMWWGVWCPTHFEEKGALLFKGQCLGDATNNVAEARGMAVAIKALLRWKMRTVQRLAAHLE